METIIGFVVASGVLGLVANYLVSGAKWLQGLGESRVDPRVMNALVSLVLALGGVVAGGQADPGQIATWLQVLGTALATWLVAHFTHKANSI